MNDAITQTGNVFKKLHWIVLGLVMLIPGLLKLFVMGPANVQTFLAGLGIPASALFVWVLIFAEIVSGALILARVGLEYVVVIPIIIMLTAAFTAHWGNWPQVLVHIAMATGYGLFGYAQEFR